MSDNINTNRVIQRVSLLVENGMTENEISKEFNYSGKNGERDLQVVARGKKLPFTEVIAKLDDMLRDRDIPIPADAADVTAGGPQRQSERERQNGQQGNVDDRIDVDQEPHQEQRQQQAFTAWGRHDGLQHEQSLPHRSAAVYPQYHQHDQRHWHQQEPQPAHRQGWREHAQVTARDDEHEYLQRNQQHDGSRRPPSSRHYHAHDEQYHEQQESPRTRNDFAHKLDAAMAENKSLRTERDQAELDRDAMHRWANDLSDEHQATLAEKHTAVDEKHRAVVVADKLWRRLDELQAKYDSSQRENAKLRKQATQLEDDRQKRIELEGTVAKLQEQLATPQWDGLHQHLADGITAQHVKHEQAINSIRHELAAQRAECAEHERRADEAVRENATLCERLSAVLVEREEIEQNGAACIAALTAKCNELEAVLAMTHVQRAEHEQRADAAELAAAECRDFVGILMHEIASLRSWVRQLLAHPVEIEQGIAAQCAERKQAMDAEASLTALPAGQPTEPHTPGQQETPAVVHAVLASENTPRSASVHAAADLVPRVELDEAAVATQLPPPAHVAQAPPTIAEVSFDARTVAGDSPTSDDGSTAATDEHELLDARGATPTRAGCRGVPMHPRVARRLALGVRAPAVPPDVVAVTPPWRRLWCTTADASPAGASRELSPEMASLLPPSLESPFVAAAETPSDVAPTPARREESVAAPDDSDADAGELRTFVREDDNAALRVRLFSARDHTVAPQPTSALQRSALGRTFP